MRIRWRSLTFFFCRRDFDFSNFTFQMSEKSENLKRNGLRHQSAMFMGREAAEALSEDFRK